MNSAPQFFRLPATPFFLVIVGGQAWKGVRFSGTASVFLERVQQRIADDPLIMRTRRQTAEHPSGMVKTWMGATHLTMKYPKNVATEMAQHVPACNMKRVMKILGGPAMRAALQARMAPAIPAAG
ncbi:hypothetical protein [Mangrovicoccus sp. HB161399]|uniref:hypothetical protein n=1 Tax=Mangrovicoccus sp. HB161399 TaxID=2720392 RepID=UPI001552DFD1|nr:hypothetical protein [Mangrovicoccus sp. HB161399]